MMIIPWKISAQHKAVAARKKRASRLVEILEQRIAPATFTWSRLTGAAWETPANWNVSGGTDADGIPDADDDVIINSAPAVTVTVSSAQAAHSLSITGDNHLSLTAGSLTISVASTVTNIDVSGGGVLSATEQLTLTGASSLSGSGAFSGLIRNEGTLTISTGDPNLRNGTLTNAGTIIDQNARLDFEAGGKLVNTADGLFVITATGGGGAFFGNFGGPGFDNSGIFRLSGNQTVNLGGTPFNNLNGRIDVTAGNLQLSSGGTWQGGNLTVATNAVLDLSVGTKTLTGTLTGSGAGSVNFSSGILAAGTGGEVFNFPEGLFNWGGSGTLTGAEGFTNSGSITITTGDPNLSATTLINHGTITDQGARLDFEGAGKLVNAADGLFVISATGGGGAFFGNFGGPGFDNSGIFRLSGNQTVNLGGTPFNNLNGHVDVTAGNLQLSSGGTWQGGNLTVATNAVLDLSGGTKTVTGTLTGSGAGSVNFSSGILAAGTGGEVFNFPEGLFNWGGSGTLTGAEGFTNSVSITITTGDPNLSATTLINHGTITDQGARLDFEGGGKLVNTADGLFVITAAGGNGPYLGNLGGPGFDNLGTFRLSGNQTVNLGGTPFNNLNGRIDVTAGNLQFSSDGTWQGGNLTVAANAVLDLSVGTKTVTGTLTGSGAGSVNFSSGLLATEAGGEVFNFPEGLFHWGGSGTLTGTEGFTNSGSITITTGDPNLNTTTLINHGTITDQGARLDFEGGGKLVNATDGLFVITAAGGNGPYLGNLGGLGFDNLGTFRLAGNQTVNLGNTPFNDLAGRIDVTAGNLQLSSSGTWNDTVMTVASGASLDLSGGTKTWTGAFSGTGEGVIAFNSGQINITAAGATFDFVPTLLQWGGSGTLAGPGALVNAGTITLTTGDPNLNSIILTNHGTIVDQSVRLDFEAGGKLVNAADGLFVITASGGGGAYLGNLGGLGFDNSGIFRLAGNQTVNLGGTPFNNLDGQIDVTAGNLLLSSSGTWQNGSFTVAANAAVDLSGGTKTLTGTLTGSGAGNVNFSSATLAAGAGGAVLNFPEGFFQWGGSGTLTGADGFTNNGSITLTTGDPNLNTTTLTNHGTITNKSVRFDFESNGKLVNAADGLFVITAIGGGGAYLGNLGGPGFDNAGIFRLSGNQTVNLGGTPFNNLGGRIDVTAGSLQISSSGTWQGGNFTVAANAAVDLSGGTKTLTGTLTGSGAGNVNFSSATLAAGAGGAVLNFPEGFFQWGGSGTLTGADGFTNNGSITLTTGDPNLNTTTLTNHGTITNKSVRFDFESNGKLVNAADGLFVITATGGGGAYLGNLGGPGFDNSGIFRLSGNQTVNLGGTPFNNTGVVEVAAGTLNLSNLAQLPASTLTGGTWRALAGATLNFPNNVTVNNGVVEILGNVPQLNAITANNGTLLLGPGHTLTTTGALSNSGTLDIAGRLNVTGNYTQTATATLIANVGSMPGGSAAGSVNITGSATLAGTLDVVLAGGFGPVTGQVYPVVTYASHTGTFSTFTGLSIGGIPFFDAIVGATAVKLTAIHDAPDLRPENISIPATGFLGLPGTFTFTVKNLNDVATLASSWSDAIYLSTNEFLDASDVFVGRVAHQGVLAAGASYTASLTAPLPAILPGDYRVIVVADEAGQSPDSNRFNNTLVSSGAITTDLSHLVHGITESNVISAGQNLYYQFDVPPASDVVLSASYAVPGEAKIFAKLNAIPTPANFDLSAASLTELQQKIAILGTSSQPYFLLIEGEAAAGAGQSFSLSTRDLGFEIVDTAPLTVPNFGPQNVTITGSHFTASTTVRLVDGAGALLAPANVQVQDSHTIVAQFNLTGVAPGLFDIRLGDGGAVAEAEDALQIVPVQVTHAGTISANQHWFGGLVHHITGALTVASGVTLTIDPGAIVKIDTLADFTVDGSLIADGTLAQPIIFTSFRDDANGGDTNADGSATAPQAGDWGRIYISGNALFDHTELLYGSGTRSGTWEQTGVIRTTGNAALTFTNSAIRDAFFDGILAWGGSATIDNSVFVRVDRAISAHPGSPVTVTNSTFDANRIALLTHGGTLTVSNSIIANSLESGIQFDFGAFLGGTNNDVFSTVPGSVKYRNQTDLTGTSGNISADPKFKNAAAGDYRLNFQSLAIDSAAGALAPSADFNGLARYDDPRMANSGTGLPSFADMGAFEFVENAPSKIDLVIGSVSGQPIVTGGQISHVTWTVRNAGSDTIRGAWHDTLQLVSNDGIVILDAATVLSTATLGPGQSATFAADVKTPFGTEGQYYWQVRTNSLGEVFEGANSGNNLGSADEQSALKIPELIAGMPVTGTFTGNNSEGGLLYKIHPAAGSDVRLAIDRADAGLTEIFVEVGQAPTRTSFFDHVPATVDPNARVEISNALDTDYYVLVVPRTIPGGSTTFTLSSVLASFQLESLGITQGSNTGTVTIPLLGSQFGADLTAQITPLHGRPLNAQTVRVESSTLAYATFDLNDFDSGAYDVSVTTHGQTDTLENSFNVIAGTAGDQVRTKLILPDRVRAGRVFTAYLEYTNTGLTDALAPIIQLTSATGNPLRLSGSDVFTTDLSFLGISPDGAAGILRPGETVRMPFEVQAVSGTNSIAAAVSMPASDPYDFARLKNELRPEESAFEFDTIFETTIHGSRTTTADYLKLLSDAATLYALRNGETSRSTAETLSFLISDTFLENHTHIRGHVFLGDTLHPAAGVLVSAADSTGLVTVSALSTADGLVRFIDTPASDLLPAGTLAQMIPAGSYGLTFYDVLAPANLQTVNVPVTGHSAEQTWVVQPGGVISGHAVVPPGIVFDANAPTASVVATSSTGAVFGRTLEPNGTYQLKGLPDGIYSVALASGGQFAPPQPFAGITVKNGGVVSLDNLVGTLGGSVSGTVLSVGNAPLAGVTVTATGAFGEPVSAFTDAAGHYVLEHVAPGPHLLTARLNTFASGTQNAVPITENQLTSGQNFTLQPLGTLSGTVLGSGSPVAGVPVQLENANGDILGFDITDSAGHYSLPNLVAGSDTLFVDAQRFALSSEAITITAGQSQTHDVVLGQGSSVSGIVRQTGTNAPLDSVLVQLLTPGNAVVSAPTDANGKWSFSRMPAGHYAVMLPDGSNRHEFDITTSGTAINVNFELNVGTLSGKITLPQGSSVGGHTLAALMKNGQVLWQTLVAPDGTYGFELITPGAYDLAFSDSEFDYPIVSGIVVAAGADTAVPNVSAGSASLQITATDGVTGEPISDAGFLSVTQLGLPGAASQANYIEVPPSGKISVEHLVPGEYLISIAVPGHALLQKIVTVGSEGSTLLSLATPAAANLSGQLTDGSAGIAGLTVTAYNTADPRLHWQAFSDATGHYTLPALPGGSFKVVVTDERPGNPVTHFATASAAITVPSGGSATQNLNLAAGGITVSGDVADGILHRPSQGTAIVLNADGVRVASAPIDLRGHYSISTLAPGSYTIRAEADGFVIDSRNVTVAASQTLAGVDLAAHWFVDPPGLGDIVDGITSTIGDLLGGLADAVKTVLVPPDEASRLQRPSFDLLPPDCPCPKALGWWAIAVSDDRFARDQFEALQDLFDANIGINSANVGLFGAKLGLLAARLYLKGAADAGKVDIAGSITSTEQKLGDTYAAYGNGEIGYQDLLSQTGQLQGVRDSLGTLLGTAKAAGTLRSGLTAGIGAVQTGEGLIQQTLSSLGKFVHSPSTEGFLSALDKANSLASAISNLDGAVKLLGGGSQGAFSKKISDITAYLAPILQAAKGVVELKQGYDAFLNAKDRYEKTIADRDIAKSFANKAILECLENCHLDDPPKPRVPDPPPKTFHHDPPKQTPTVTSFDPNDKLTTGFGAQHYIKPGSTLPYTVLFENMPTASAAAQMVTVTDQLSNKLDWASVELGDIGFNGVTISVPAGLTHFETTVNIASDPNPVHVIGDFNAANGLLKWTITSTDPVTGSLPDDPLAGFLPPDNAEHAGEGFVNYVAKTLGTLANGDIIANKATIVFDTNAPIDTPVAINTIDSAAPASTVTVLPDHSVSTSFLVSWSGADAAGSGVSAYDVFVSDNGAPFTPFQIETSAASATFTGKLGHTYRFYSQALDNAGNLEAAPDHADTLISVGELVSTAKKTFTDSDGDIYTVKLSGPGKAQIIQDNGHIALLQLNGTTAKSKVSIVVKTSGGGDGKVELGGVISDGSLGSLTASKAFLTNAGVQLPGTLGKLVLGGVRGGADLVFGGGASNKTSLTFGIVGDGTRITTGAQITALKAVDIGHGTLTAAALGSLSTSAGGMDANLTITGKVGSITVKGGAASGTWIGSQFGAIKVTGGTLDADILASGAISGIAVTGGNLSGDITAQKLGAITVTSGSLAADVTAAEAIAKVAIKGGQLNGHLVAQSFGAVSVIDGNLSGSLTSLASAGTLKKTAALKALTINGGDLTGDVHLLGSLGKVNITASKAGLGGSVLDATVTASNIAALIVGKNLNSSGIFAGADLGMDNALGGDGINADAFSPGTIGAVKIGGSVNASVIAAGLSTSDAILKNGDDVLLGGLASRIASLIVNGAASSDSYFVGKFKAAPKVDGAAVLLPDPRFKTA